LIQPVGKVVKGYLTSRFLLDADEVQDFLDHTSKRRGILNDYGAAETPKPKTRNDTALGMWAAANARNLAND
jgi:hypothetical protein